MKTLYGDIPCIMDVRKTIIPDNVTLNEWTDETNIFKYDFGNGPVLVCWVAGELKEVVLFCTDYGTGKSLVILDAERNPIDFRGKVLPIEDDKNIYRIVCRVFPNANPAAFKYLCAATSLLQKFAWVLSQDLGPNKIAIIVIENSTPGSYGCSPEIMQSFMEDYLPVQLQLMDNRATINDRKCSGTVKQKNEGKTAHIEDARIIDRRAWEIPARISKWKYRSEEEKITRNYTSVTPYNSWNYNDPRGEVDKFMVKAIPPHLIPRNIQEMFCVKDKKTDELIYPLEYNRTVVFPILQAMEENGVLDSKRLFIITTGKWDRGYPCHYKEAHGNLRGKIEIKIAGPPVDEKGNPAVNEKGKIRTKKKAGEIKYRERKASWKYADHMAMAFYKMCREYRKENYEITERLLDYLDEMAKRYKKQQNNKIQKIKGLERGVLL